VILTLVVRTSPSRFREITGLRQGFLSEVFFRFGGHLHLSSASCGTGCGLGNVNKPVLSAVKLPGFGLVSVVASGGAT
jgi:hypothetical protein